MLGVEFDTGEHAEEVQWACFERGLLVLECGTSEKGEIAALGAIVRPDVSLVTNVGVGGSSGDVTATVGLLIERFLIRRLYGRSPDDPLLLTLGL